MYFGLFRRLPFGVFQDIFWRLKTKHPEKVVVSCPDVMFNTYSREIPDKRYAALARKWQVKKWVESNGKVRWYGCRRGHPHTSSDACNFHSGIAVPPCDLENLADAIKFVMKECEEAGLFCELQEGTLLGNLFLLACLNIIKPFHSKRSRIRCWKKTFPHFVSENDEPKALSSIL